MTVKAYFRFYEELNDYLPARKRKITFSQLLKARTPVKDAICLLGVPPNEVDLVLVNSESVPFNHIIHDGDRISVYPVFESLDISTVTRLRDMSLIQLIQDSHKINHQRS